MASVVASIGGRIAVRARASSSSDDPQPVPVRIPRPSRRAMLSVPVSIAIATRAPDAVDASAPGEWGYADSSNGPARWSDILDADGQASYPACGCAACQQSPIDLVRTAAKGNVRVGSLADRLVAPAKPVTLAVSQKHGTPNYVATDQGNDAAVVAPDDADAGRTAGKRLKRQVRVSSSARSFPYFHTQTPLIEYHPITTQLLTIHPPTNHQPRRSRRRREDLISRSQPRGRSHRIRCSRAPHAPPNRVGVQRWTGRVATAASQGRRRRVRPRCYPAGGEFLLLFPYGQLE